MAEPVKARARRRHRFERRSSATATFYTVALVLLCLVFPAISSQTAFAQEVTFRDHFFSDTSAAQAYYFDPLGTLGIIRGDSGIGGPARPSQPVTRAEVAVMVIRLLSLDPGLALPETEPLTFTDSELIPTWAMQAVSTCTALDIVSGVPDGRGGYSFCPAEIVNGAEALTMLLRALGNDRDITGGWPSGYVYRAFESGLLSGDVSEGDWRFLEPLTPLTRAQTAYLLHNALFCWRDFDPGEPGREGEFSRSPIGSSLGGYSVVAEVDLLTRRLTAADGRVFDFGGTVVAEGVAGRSDLLGRRVFWLADHRGRITYIRRYAQEEPITGYLHEIQTRADAAGVESVILEDGRVIPCAQGAVVELNGQRWPFDPATILPVAEVTAVLDRGQAVYVSIMQEDLPEAVIRGLTLSPSDLEGSSVTGTITFTISMGEGNITLQVTADTEVYLNDQPAELPDLRELDVIYAATEGSTPKRALRVYAYRNRVTGAVTDMARQYSREGFRWKVTVRKVGSSETGSYYFSPFCEHMVGLDLVGRELTFCLNREGQVTFFATPGPSDKRPGVVKCMRDVDLGEQRLLTVDWRGSELTYSVAPGVALPRPGTLVLLRPSASGEVSSLEKVHPARFEAKVLSTDASAGRLALTRDTLTWALNVWRVPIYEAADPSVEDSVVGDHVSLSSLEPGQTVWLDDPGAPNYILVGPSD